MSPSQRQTSPPIAERRFGPVRWRLYAATHPTAEFEPLLALVGLLFVIALVALPLDLMGAVMGGCRFHDWTGYPCASCGATRGAIALGHGQIGEALRLNPLFVGGFLCLAIYSAISALIWWRGWPRPRVALVGAPARWGALAVCLVLIGLNWAFLIWDHR
jgi:hypothetical protein